MRELWLTGPVEGVPAELLPCAHAFLQSAEDIPAAVAGLSTEQIWLSPGGAASIGFHLQHIAGALERLLTYAAGRQLTSEQIVAAKSERDPGDPARDAETMIAVALAGIESALATLRALPVSSLAEPREVGRARLPSTVLGIVFHCAEHTQRHTGQLITTAKIIRGLALQGTP